MNKRQNTNKNHNASYSVLLLNIEKPLHFYSSEDDCSSTMRSNARLAQSVERETLNLKVAGSTPASGSNPDALREKPSNISSFLSFFAGCTLILFRIFLYILVFFFMCLCGELPELRMKLLVLTKHGKSFSSKLLSIKVYFLLSAISRISMICKLLNSQIQFAVERPSIDRLKCSLCLLIPLRVSRITGRIMTLYSSHI